MRALDKAAATFDRAMIVAARLGNRASRAERLPHEERMIALAAIRDAYGATEIWSSPDVFFTPPDPIRPALRPVRSAFGTALDASWPSRFEPYLPELRTKYLAFEENRTAHARLFVGPTPRPAIVLIHGYMAGQWHVEQRAWPIRWLGERYDLAIAVLPFHAVRGPKGRRAPPPFPGADPRVTNEGFRQAIFDLRALAAFLRARGAPSVGVMGMSLGGYTTALLATVERELAFAVPIIPLASLADFALEQGRLGTGDEARMQHAALEEANRIVSPLARPSVLPPERVLVVAAAADRITPPSHADRLARHFGASKSSAGSERPNLLHFTGGHILQFGRGDAFRAIGRWLDGLR